MLGRGHMVNCWPARPGHLPIFETSLYFLGFCDAENRQTMSKMSAHVSNSPIALNTWRIMSCLLKPRCFATRSRLASSPAVNLMDIGDVFLLMLRLLLLLLASLEVLQLILLRSLICRTLPSRRQVSRFRW